VIFLVVVVEVSVCVTSEKEVAVTLDNTVGVVALHVLSADIRFSVFCHAYSVLVAVTLAVDKAVTLLKIGKVVVLVTVGVVSTHLMQTVLTKAFACFAKLLNADCLASFEVVGTLVGGVLAAVRLALSTT
jgi:hypothetical protein